MKCDEMTPLLPSLGDGSLGAAKARRLRTHLESCGSCRAALSRLERLEDLLGSGLRVPDPGERFFGAQRERLRKIAQTGRRPETPAAGRPPVARFVWAAAAAILILAAGAAFWHGVPARVPERGSPTPGPGPSAVLPKPKATESPDAPKFPTTPNVPSDSTTAKKAPPEKAPPSPTILLPDSALKAPPPPPVARSNPPAFPPGTSDRLAAMTDEAVDIGLAETPRDRVVALFRAAEARLREVGQVMHQDPGLASELAAAYLLLLGDGVRSVLRDGAESPQELELARTAAAERARIQETALVELGNSAQGKLKGTLEDALAMSRELGKP